MKKIGFLLYNNGEYGGAEKRVANIISWLSNNTEHKIYCYISNRMFNWLIKQGYNFNPNICFEFYDDNYHKKGKINDSDLNYNRKSYFYKMMRNTKLWKKLSDLKSIIKKSKDIRRWVKNNKIDIVHSFHAGGELTLQFFLNKSIKTVYSIVDSSGKNGVPLQWIGNLSLKSVFKFVDKIDFLSEGVYQNYKKVGMRRLDRKKYVSPCSFIDYSRAAIGEKNSNLITFAASRFEKIKNPLLVVEAINMLVRNQKRKAIKVLMMGKGYDEDNVKKRIDEYGLSRVIKIRYENNVIEQLKSSLIFLSLQQYNNYPSQSLLEAMACGNAIVATDVGETRKIIDVEVGILVKPDAEEVAGAIKYLLEHPEIAKEMGKKARERVLREHTVEKHASYLLHLYNK